MQSEFLYHHQHKKREEVLNNNYVLEGPNSIII